LKAALKFKREIEKEREKNMRTMNKIKMCHLHFCFLIILIILTGCATTLAPTTQQVPVPKTGEENNSAIIIIKRTGDLAARGRTVEIYDNGMFIGGLGYSGELKWARKEGIIELDIKQNETTVAHSVFAADRGKIYTIIYNYVAGTVKLEGDNASLLQFTSSPPGATVYAGQSPETLRPLKYKTPFTIPRPSHAPYNRWASEYYKMSLEGYNDSPVVFKNNSFGNREIHFDLSPIEVSKSASEPQYKLPSEKILTPSTQPITITITSPEISRGLKIVEKRSALTIIGHAHGGSGIAEILVNGQQATLDEEGSFSADILLKIGKNIINVVARDSQRNTVTKTFTINRSTEKIIAKPTNIETPKSAKFDFTSTGKYFALIIAVQNYNSREINKLDYPITDATTLKNVLVKEYNFDDKNITFLKNPDKRSISKAFNDLRATLTGQDNLLIFYAGHGVWMEDMREGFWLPRDASGANDPTDWISNSTIRSYVRAIKAKHILLVSDACFAGAIFKVRDPFINKNVSIEKIYEMPSRKALTSGSLKTVPDRSVFVEYLVKRLKENQDKYLDAQKLFISFKEAVINNSPINQIPLYGVINEAGDEGGDFIFTRR